MPKKPKGPVPFGPCRIRGCGRTSITHKHQLCWGHYKRYLKGLPVKGEPLRRQREIPAYSGR